MNQRKIDREVGPHNTHRVRRFAGGPVVIGMAVSLAALSTSAVAQSPEDYDWSFDPGQGVTLQVDVPVGEQRRIVFVGWLRPETANLLHADGVLRDSGSVLIVKDQVDGLPITDSQVYVRAIATYLMYQSSCSSLSQWFPVYGERLSQDTQYVVLTSLIRFFEMLRDIVARAAGIHAAIGVAAAGTGVTVPAAVAQAEALRQAAAEEIPDAVSEALVGLIEASSGQRVMSTAGMKTLLAQHAFFEGLGCGVLVGAHLLGLDDFNGPYRYENAMLIHMAESFRIAHARVPSFGVLHDALYPNPLTNPWGFTQEQLGAIFGNFTWGVIDRVGDLSFVADAAPHLSVVAETWEPVYADPRAAEALRFWIEEGVPILENFQTFYSVHRTLEDYASSVEGEPGIALQDYFDERAQQIQSGGTYFLLPYRTAIEWGHVEIAENLLLASPVQYVTGTAGTESGSVVLSWISPTFAGGGTAQSYEVGYVPYIGPVESIRAAWDVATSFNTDQLEPQDPGVTEQVTISSLKPSSQYLFMVRARSPSGALTPLLRGIVGTSSADPGAITLWGTSANPAAPTIDTPSVEFSVMYRHAGGLLPLTGAKLFFNGVAHNMQRVAGNPSSGAEYRATLAGPFTAGAVYPYYFLFTDINDYARRDPGGSGLYFLSVGDVLRSPVVVPDAGANPRGFTFRVQYRHPHGTHPSQRWLYVDGCRYDMTRVWGDFRTGATYERRVVLNSGSHTHYFQFSDGTSTFRLPLTGTIAGPAVAAFRNAAVVLTQGSIPASIIGGTPLAIGVAAVNNGSVVETTLQLRLLVDGTPVGQTITIEPVLPGGSSWQRVFTWTPPVQDAEQTYTLTIEVLGVSGDLNPDDNQFSASVRVTPPPGRIIGVVRDGPSNAPKPGATVFVVTGPQNASTTSDADGNYILDGLPPGNYVIAARTDDGSQSSNSPTIAVHAAQQYPYNITLEQGNIVQLTSYGPPLMQAMDLAASWSSDGSRLAYVHYQDGIPGEWRIFTLNTGSSTVVPGFSPNLPLGSAQWIDDNTALVGGYHTPSQLDGIHKVRVSDGARLLTLPRSQPSGLISGFCAAPGGTRLYFYAAGTAIRSVRISDFADPRIDVAGLAGDPGRIVISRDGRYLALAALRQVFDLQTSSYLDLSDFPAIPENYHLSWLADASGLLYGSGDLYLYLLNGERRIQITFGVSLDSFPDAGPSSLNKIAFSSDRNGGSMGYQSLFMMDLNPTDWAVAFSEVTQSGSAITPNGDEVDDALSISYELTAAAEVTLKVYDGAGALAASPVIDELQPAGPGSISWTGTGLNGLLVPSGLYFVALDGRDDAGQRAIGFRSRVTVARDIRQATDGRYATWSPDGTWMAYLKNGNELWTAEADGSNPALVYTAPYVDLTTIEGTICISPDNQWIAFGRNPPSDSRIALEKIRRDGTGLQRLASPGEIVGGEQCVSFCNPSWSSMTNQVVCAYGTLVSADFCTMGPDGSGKQRITSLSPHQLDIVAYSAWCSPTESTMIFSSPHGDPYNQSNLYQIGLDGSALTPVTAWWGYETFPRFTAEASHLLFGAGILSPSLPGATDLFVLNRFTGSRRALIGGVRAAESSADGRRLLVSIDGTTVPQGSIVTLGYSLIGGILEGAVLDDSGQPVEGATIEARRGENVVGFAVSNSLGYYRLADLPVDTLTLMAHKPRCLDSATHSVATSAGVTSTAPDLLLVPLPAALVNTLRPGGRYTGLLELGAEALTTSVSSVAYEYRAAGGSWLPIGSATEPPYAVSWDAGGVVGEGQEATMEVRAVASSGDLIDTDPVVLSNVLDRIAPASEIVSPIHGQLVCGRTLEVSVETSADAEQIVMEGRSYAAGAWQRLAETNQLQHGSGAASVTLTISTEGVVPGDDYELRAWAVDEAGNVEPPPSSISVGIDLDSDGDGTGDSCDSCTDSDGDSYGDPGFAGNTCAQDNCPSVPNPGQEDCDGDGVGDACELLAVGDIDADGDVDTDDLAGFIAVLTGTLFDSGPVGRADVNGDGSADGLDIQWIVDAFLNPAGPFDCNQNSVPDECDPDSDGDGVIDDCDPDKDGDGDPNASDCAASDQSVHHGAIEVCNDGVDNDCDGQADCNDADCNSSPACEPCGNGVCGQGESPCTCAADCGSPPSTETNCADGLDNDCDGMIDALDPDCRPARTWYRDADGDGFGDARESMQGVDQPIGYVINDADCNDDDAGVHPGVAEVVCDGIDQDCAGGDSCPPNPGAAANPTPVSDRNAEPQQQPCRLGLCGVCLVPATVLSLIGMIGMKVKPRRRKRESRPAVRPRL